MTENDLVVAVLAFVQTNGPIGAVARLAGALAAALAVFYLWAKITARFSSRKTFDVGGEFDHFYSRFLRGAYFGVVCLIYAAYLALWLSSWPTSPQLWWLHEPSYSVFYGMLDTLILVGLVAMGSWGLAKAAWFGLRWLRLEARGVLWHIAENGEPYRVMWLRRNGELFYDPRATRGKLAGEELTTLRERRVRLGTRSVIAVVAIIVWLHGQTFVETLYPALSDWFVSFLQWVLPTCISLVFFFVVIRMTVSVIAALLDELVYRSGAQFIAGAKLLEPDAWRLGRQNAEQQKAHGNANFVPAADDVRRMFGHGGS